MKGLNLKPKRITPSASALLILAVTALTLGGCQGWFANRPPVAVAVASPRNGEAPLEVKFDGTSSYDPDGSIVKFNWDFGDGYQSNEPSPAHIYADDGTYTVVLTVTDNQGATDEDVLQISVTNPKPRAVIDASPLAGPAPLEVTFDASGSVDPAGLSTPSIPLALPIAEAITFFLWDFGDGETGVGRRVVHTYMEAGTYTATLTVVDDDGAIATDTVEIWVFEGIQTGSVKMKME